MFGSTKTRDEILTREALRGLPLGSSEGLGCSLFFSFSSKDAPDDFSISFRTANHILINCTLSGPLQETDASSNLFTVCLKLLKLRAAYI